MLFIFGFALLLVFKLALLLILGFAFLLILSFAFVLVLGGTLLVLCTIVADGLSYFFSFRTLGLRNCLEAGLSCH